MNDCLVCLARRRLLRGAATMAGLSVLPRTWAVRPEVSNLRLADMDWAPLGERNRRKLLSVDSQTGGLT